MVLAGEERLALEHFGKDAPGTPDVDLDAVLLPGKHDLGGAVVARRDVAGHLGVLDTGETKVTDLEVTVLVDEDVAGLEIAVNDTSRVNVFETALEREGGLVKKEKRGDWTNGETHENLVQKVLDKLALEGTGSKQTVQVGAEQLGHKVAAVGKRGQREKAKRRQAYMSSSGEMKMSLKQMIWEVISSRQQRRWQ